MQYKTGNVNEEKHVPFIEETATGYRVTVGKPALHPMTEEHLIEYIELFVDGKSVARIHLAAGDAPVAEFNVSKGSNVYATEHCNLHGTWKNDL